MGHVIHHHPKRDEVFDRARQLGTIHEDTRRVAKLLDHADFMDEQLADRDIQIDWLKNEVRELKEDAQDARWEAMGRDN